MKKGEFENELEDIKNQIEGEKRSFEERMLKMKNEYEETEESFKEQIQQKEERLEGLKYYKTQKEIIEAKKNALKEQCENVQKKIDKIHKGKDAEIKASNDKLKKDILELIQKKKKDLFSLKEDHFEGKIKLVIQQNHSLVTELEYQTLQIENLAYKNEKLRIHLQSLRNDKEIHKNIELELGKRVIYLSRLIEELRSKNKGLLERYQDTQEERKKLEIKKCSLLEKKENEESLQNIRNNTLSQINNLSKDNERIKQEEKRRTDWLLILLDDYTRRYNLVFLVIYLLKCFKNKLLRDELNERPESTNKDIMSMVNRKSMRLGGSSKQKSTFLRSLNRSSFDSLDFGSKIKLMDLFKTSLSDFHYEFDCGIRKRVNKYLNL